MKDLVTKSQENLKTGGADIIRAAALHLLMAAVGFTSSKAVVFDTLMPFGLVFTAGCSGDFIPSVAIGAFLGYFIPAVGTGGFRYIAALLAVLAIRLMLSGYKKIAENPWFLCGVAALSCGVTGGVTYNGAPTFALLLVAEILIVFGATYIICRISRALGRSLYGLSSDELCCLLITAVIILSGLYEFKIFGISVGAAAAVLLILVSAKHGGTLAGSVSGIAVTFSCAVSGTFEGGFGIYAFAGMMAGMFSSLGKYAQSAAVTASAVIGLSFVGFQSGSAQFITEVIVGSAIFLLLPRSVSIMLGKIFYCQPKLVTAGGINEALTMRLDLASGALRDVSETVSQVSQELSKINSPDFKTVLAYIEQDACAGCKLRVHCWENKKDSTLAAVMQMIEAVKKNDDSSSPVLEEFNGRCLRVQKMKDTVNRRYSEYASLLAAENRIEEVRSVVSDQFEGVSNMLSELAQDFADSEQFDNSAATLAASALKNIGICAEECTARIDKFGRMTLEIRVKRDNDTVFNRLQIMKMLSLCCERDFDIPNINQIGASALITVNEHAVYKVDIGVKQESACGSMCGDACRYFNDGRGHFIMVLSDGMGTGGRAAVDGAMASGLMSRLLKAGFGYDCSLKILNSSMLFKSTDESLATVDIASIDLFTGMSELYKAGAAPTLVRRNGRTGKAESTSLPIGILRDVTFDRAGIRLRANDILLLISDGATADGTDWIRAELECWRDGGAQDLAEHICDCARRRRGNNRADDITVMAAILEKAI